MKSPSPRPARWRRRRAERRDLVRRMLVGGALVGLGVGLLAQPFIGAADLGEIEGLVRLALLLPAGIFVAWWLLMPGIALEEQSDLVIDPATEPVDVDARIAAIEAAFDDSATSWQATRRRASADQVVREQLHGSIRRDVTTGAPDHAAYTLRRSGRPGDAADQAAER